MAPFGLQGKKKKKKEKSHLGCNKATNGQERTHTPLPLRVRMRTGKRGTIHPGRIFCKLLVLTSQSSPHFSSLFDYRAALYKPKPGSATLKKRYGREGAESSDASSKRISHKKATKPFSSLRELLYLLNSPIEQDNFKGMYLTVSQSEKKEGVN